MGLIVFLFLACAILPAQESKPAYDPISINYGIGAIVPANQELRPLTREQRTKLFLKDAFTNPITHFRAISLSGLDTVQNEPSQWGSNVGGYGQRWASRFGRSTIGTAIEHGGAALTGLEPRFVACRCKGFFPRLGHAMALEVMTYNNEGKLRFFWPRLAAAVGSEWAAAAWTPNYKWSAEGARNAAQQLYFGVGFNVLREFGPEIKRMARLGRKPKP
jgi:hypothetical protein